MPMANPRRNVGEESIRVQEFTGGFRPREMLGDYDVNANENSDGLSNMVPHPKKQWNKWIGRKGERRHLTK